MATSDTGMTNEGHKYGTKIKNGKYGKQMENGNESRLKPGGPHGTYESFTSKFHRIWSY